MATQSDLTSVLTFGDAPATTIMDVKQTGLCRLTLLVRNGRRYIFKSLLPEVAHISQYQALLRKEFDIAISLDHPCILRCLNFETHPDLGSGILMEWIDGMTLDAFLAAAPPQAERYQIACQLAGALAYAHTKSIAHRDLKPDNMMVTHYRHDLRLIDFGLADADDFLIMKQSGATEAFGAPEQLAGTASDCRSDVYSFGLLLKLLKLGRRYDRLADRCLAADPVRRPAMDYVSERLEKMRPHRHRPRRVVLTAAIAGAILVAAGLFVYKQQSDSRVDSPSAPDDIASQVSSQPKDMSVLNSLVTLLSVLPPEETEEAAFHETDDLYDSDYENAVKALLSESDSTIPIKLLLELALYK